MSALVYLCRAHHLQNEAEYWNQVLSVDDVHGLTCVMSEPSADSHQNRSSAITRTNRTALLASFPTRSLVGSRGNGSEF